MTPTDRLRAYANLPSEVPDSLIAAHLDLAAEDLRRRSGFPDAPAGFEPVWDEALTVRALATALPWLNTFALDGAAKVGRLEGTVEFRFLTPEDVASRETRLMARFERLLSILPRTASADTDAVVNTTTFTLYAI